MICGKRIPAQCAVSAAVWVLHHDPRFWTDPWKFDPERFAPENRCLSRDVPHLKYYVIH